VLVISTQGVAKAFSEIRLSCSASIRGIFVLPPEVGGHPWISNDISHRTCPPVGSVNLESHKRVGAIREPGLRPVPENGCPRAAPVNFVEIQFDEAVCLYQRKIRMCAMEEEVVDQGGCGIGFVNG
jgi:hypothetical protein